MAVETRPQDTPPHPSDNTALILAAIDRVAADSRSSYEQLAADSRSNFESIRADIRQLYLLNILTLLTALGALITGLFTLLTR